MTTTAEIFFFVIVVTLALYWLDMIRARADHQVEGADVLTEEQGREILGMVGQFCARKIDKYGGGRCTSVVDRRRGQTYVYVADEKHGHEIPAHLISDYLDEDHPLDRQAMSKGLKIYRGLE